MKEKIKLLTLTILVICIASFLVSLLFSNGEVCIRLKYNQAIKCECDFATKEEWLEFRELSKGRNSEGWESVIFDEGYNPCAKEVSNNKNVTQTTTVPETIEVSSSFVDSSKSTISDADLENEIKLIKKRFYSINYDALRTDTVEGNGDEEPTSTIIYSGAKGIVKIIANHIRTSIQTSSEYYFDNGKLYFEFYSQSPTNTTKKIESRIYIYSDRVIQTIENGVKIDCRSCNYTQDSEPYILYNKFSK